MVPGIDPKVDYTFKRIFGREENRAVLIDMVNAVRQPPRGQEMVEVELLWCLRRTRKYTCSSYGSSRFRLTS
jgi:PD-(D/E)XK nuclease-like transposase